MQVRVGDRVRMRDGRVVDVTDAADQDADAWRTYSVKGIFNDGEWDAEEYISSESPAETIFVGTEVRYAEKGEAKGGGTVVSDMSEVVSILN